MDTHLPALRFPSLLWKKSLKSLSFCIVQDMQIDPCYLWLQEVGSVMVAQRSWERDHSAFGSKSKTFLLILARTCWQTRKITKVNRYVTVLNLAITQLLCWDKAGRVQGGRCDGTQTRCYLLWRWLVGKYWVWVDRCLFTTSFTLKHKLCSFELCVLWALKETDAFKASEWFIKLSSLCTSEML